MSDFMPISGQILEIFHFPGKNWIFKIKLNMKHNGVTNISAIPHQKSWNMSTTRSHFRLNNF